jgi:hypothetical protein
MASACSTAQMEKYPGAKEEISKIDPQAKSLLIVGMRMVSSSVAASQRNIRIAQFSTKLLYEELARVGFALMRDLDDAGFSGSPIPTYLPLPMQRETGGLIAELSLPSAICAWRPAPQARSGLRAKRWSCVAQCTT